MKFAKKKSLGQNFLKDESVLDKIIKAGELSSLDNVLEIGPGEGVLTKKLLSKVKQVVAIEKDERMKNKDSDLQKLSNKQGLLDSKEKFKVYFGDILDVNLPSFLEENNFINSQGYKVIANIPYYITGKILRLLFEQRPLPKIIVLLVQKEVADRIIAKNNRQSILSLSVQYYAKVEIVDYVSREAFDPVPNVDSAILKITPFPDIKKCRQKEKDFFRIVKIGFSSPRKILISNLKNGLNNIDKKLLEEIFEGLKIDKNIRAEKLTLEEWKKLASEINILPVDNF